MREQIDYKSTIEKGSLKLKIDISTLLVDNMVFIAILGLPIYCAWIYISRLIQANIYFHHWTEISLVTIFGFAWTIYLLNWVIKVNQLHEIQGIDKALNRKVVTETFTEWKWHIAKNNKNFIVAYPDNGIFKPDRQISILFSETDILINVTAYSWRNLKSPFFPIITNKTTKQIKLELENRLKKTLPNNG